MASKGNPWDIPDWHSIQRETMLISQLIGAGVTALGRANYADKKGEYYRAFFELSVGMERFAKLILVVDYALTHQGAMPDEQYVRQFGHDLVCLFAAVDKVAADRSLRLKHQRPNDAVAKAIVENLDAFADAKRGRYANFAGLGNPQSRQQEPIEKWWTEVAEAVFEERYYNKKVQQRVEDKARAVTTMFGSYSFLAYTTETRDQLSDLEAASRRSGQTQIVQKWSRYHALTIARWLTNVYCDLSRNAFGQGIDAFSGSWEFFDTYRVEDDLMKTRKIWSLD